LGSLPVGLPPCQLGFAVPVGLLYVGLLPCLLASSVHLLAASLLVLLFSASQLRLQAYPVHTSLSELCSFAVCIVHISPQ
jgi:preprotein translocase subunit SecY